MKLSKEHAVMQALKEVQSKGELRTALLSVIQDNPNTTNVDEVLKMAATHLSLTPDQLAFQRKNSLIPLSITMLQYELSNLNRDGDVTVVKGEIVK